MKRALEQTKMFSRRFAKRPITRFLGDDRVHGYGPAAYESADALRDAILERP